MSNGRRRSSAANSDNGQQPLFRRPSVIVTEKKHIVATERCGPLSVYVQGDVTQQEKKAIFLTVHDLGCNHTVFHDFVEHPCMSEIKERSVFIHIDIPGQEDNSTPLEDEFNFPTLQMLGEDLVTVLDFLHVKYVFGVGEGAGANILMRFGLAHQARCMGLILINCTAGTAGVWEFFKDKVMNRKLSNVGMNPSTENYLVFHKFGKQMENATAKERADTIHDFQARLRSNINPRNLKKYVDSFLNRKDITQQLGKLAVDTLLVTGSLGAHLQTVMNIHANMDKQRASLLKVDDIGDIMTEAPEKLAQGILLFVKGQGLLTSVTMPGVERQRTFSGGSSDSQEGPGIRPPGRRQRTMSMEEYDRPNIRRLSITAPTFMASNKTEN